MVPSIMASAGRNTITMMPKTTVPHMVANWPPLPLRKDSVQWLHLSVSVESQLDHCAPKKLS